jgi:hypothetical protein
MTVSITQTLIDAGLYLIEWSSDQADPTYTIYVDGYYSHTTKATQMTYAVNPGESFVLEVLDDDSAPSYATPARPRLCWYAPSGASRHVIEQQDGATWTELADISNDDRQALSYQCPVQGDGSSVVYRITPYDAAGNAGEAITITVAMVRHPDPLSLTTAYDEDEQTLTFTEAI